MLDSIYQKATWTFWRSSRLEPLWGIRDLQLLHLTAKDWSNYAWYYILLTSHAFLLMLYPGSPLLLWNEPKNPLLQKLHDLDGKCLKLKTNDSNRFRRSTENSENIHKTFHLMELFTHETFHFHILSIDFWLLFPINQIQFFFDFI